MASSRNPQKLLPVLILVIASISVYAEVPQMINYQGRLTDSGGNPVEDDDYTIKFKIYGSEDGNDSLWSSGVQEVSVTDGLFSYLLGSNVALSDGIFNSPNRYLGITVGSDPEISRRKPFTSSAFTFQALKSDTTDYAKDIADLCVDQNKIADNSIHSAHIQNNSILSEDIAENAVNSYQIGPLAVGTSEIDDVAITTAKITNEAVIFSKIDNDAVGSGKIIDNTIMNADINSSAAISTTKISGTAVNLSSHQTITGRKTFDNSIQFGDSTMRVSNVGIAIGSEYAPSPANLLMMNRIFNNINPRRMLDINMMNVAPSGAIYGVNCYVDNADASTGHRYGGVFNAGNPTNTNANSYACQGVAYGGANAYGIYGYASGGATNYGGYFNPGLKGTGENYAGYFNGDVETVGFSAASSGGIKIDHPLDPENQYLIHSDIVSPEMKSVYDGVVILDGNGEAVVNLPDYFEALNSDFRYQLTAIGVSAPDLYISQKIEGNRFIIAGGKPNMEVSWLVMGVRNDAYAKSNRIQNEINKPDREKGLYMHPESFGLDEKKQIHYEQNRKAIEESDGRE